MESTQASQAPFAPKAQSKLGIASVVAAIVGFAIAAIAMVVIVTLGPTAPPADPRRMAAGIVMVGGTAVNLIGFVLAIASFFDRERGHVASWIGLVLNAAPFLFMCAATLLGLVLGLSGGVRP